MVNESERHGHVCQVKVAFGNTCSLVSWAHPFDITMKKHAFLAGYIQRLKLCLSIVWGMSSTYVKSRLSFATC